MRVLLVHGLGRTPLSCIRLARDLRRAGCAPELFGYVAFAQSYDRIRDRLVARLEAMGDGDYAVIGHSLGGVLLRDALPRVQGATPKHFVMLGTPNHPPRTARIAVRFPPFRWFAGSCGRRLTSEEFFAGLHPPSVPCTVVAGTRGITGRWSPFGAEANDGLVAVSEARMAEEGGILTLPVAHMFMMSNQRVRRAIRTALDLDRR